MFIYSFTFPCRASICYETVTFPALPLSIPSSPSPVATIQTPLLPSPLHPDTERLQPVFVRFAHLHKPLSVRSFI